MLQSINILNIDMTLEQDRTLDASDSMAGGECETYIYFCVCFCSAATSDRVQSYTLDKSVNHPATSTVCMDAILKRGEHAYIEAAFTLFRGAK